MFNRGDRVKVVGFASREAVLRVWEVKPHGLALCSEEGYKRAEAGGEVVAVGFPLADVKEAFASPSQDTDDWLDTPSQ